MKDLGARHVTYGATAAHYDVVGQVLLWTLEQALRAEFTADIRAAWTKVYDVLAATMQAGAAEVVECVPPSSGASSPPREPRWRWQYPFGSLSRSVSL